MIRRFLMSLHMSAADKVIDVAARKPHLRRHERKANVVWQVRAGASGEATRA